MNTGSSLYSINKMSQTDRTAIVDQLKADAEERKNQMMNLVQKTLTGQVGSFGKASGDDFWRTLASGKFTVDAATKAQAQKDISEDGYWGVKQTSQRLFDFASALAGDDVDKMKENSQYVSSDSQAQVNSEIQNILNKLSLLEEDIKGIEVNKQL